MPRRALQLLYRLCGDLPGRSGKGEAPLLSSGLFAGDAAAARVAIGFGKIRIVHGGAVASLLKMPCSANKPCTVEVQRALRLTPCVHLNDKIDVILGRKEEKAA